MNRIILTSLKTCVFLIFSLTIVCCTHKTKETDLYKKVLKVGNIELTKNQYLKMRKDFISSMNIDTLTGKLEEEFNQSVVDNYYLLADAFAKNFHKNDTLIEAVNAMADFMLVKYDGFLWKKTKLPYTKTSEEEIKKIYDQPHIIYFLDGILFEKKIIGDTTNDVNIARLKTSEDFDYYHSLADKTNGIIKTDMMSSWPVYELENGNALIKDASVGDVIGPIQTVGGILFAKLTKTDEVNKHPYNEEADRLSFRMGHLKTCDIIVKEQRNCENSCKPVYHDKNIAKYFNDKTNTSIQDLVLMEYYISDTLKKLNVKEFNNFLLYYLQQVEMKEIIDVKVNLRGKMATDYLLAKVDSIHLRNDPAFCDEFNGYLKKIVLKSYFSREIKPDLNNLDEEIEAYYAQNLQDFKEPKEMKVSCFEFKDMGSMYNAMNIIQKAYVVGNESILNDTSILKGLINFQSDLVISRENTLLSSGNYDMVIRQPLGSLSDEIIQDDKFFLFYKKQETGENYTPLELVKPYISQIIRSQKTEAVKQELIGKLKGTYSVEYNYLMD